MIKLRLFWLHLLLFPLLLCLGCKKDVEGLGVKFTLEQRALSNGLSVIMVEDHTVPIISYQTWFRVGSVDEKPQVTGLAHLFEHMMFKGTKKYGPRQFFMELEAKGAEVNAFTTRDYTAFFQNFVPHLLEKVIDLESDRMGNLQIDDDIFNTERMVVLEERRLRSESAPESKIQEALWALAYRHHPYHWPVIGYSEDLLRIETKQVKAFFDAYYKPSNATIVVVGDFQTDSLWKLIKQYYGSLSSAAAPKRKFAPEPEQTEERRLTLRDDVTTPRISQAYRISSASEEDSFALDVLANILLEGTTSRAYHSLVEVQQLALGIDGSAYTPTYPGLLTINLVLKQGIAPEEAEAALDRILRALQEHDVSKEEIQVAIRQLTVQLMDSIRTPYGLGHLLGTVQMILGDPHRFASDLQKYFSVTPADVKRVAQKYLHPNYRSVVSMIPGLPPPPSKKGDTR